MNPKLLLCVSVIAVVAACGYVAFGDGLTTAAKEPDPVLASLDQAKLHRSGLTLDASSSQVAVSKDDAEKVAQLNGGLHPIETRLVTVTLDSSPPGEGESRLDPSSVPVGRPVWAVVVSDVPPVSGRPGVPLRNIRNPYWVFFVDAKTGEFLFSQGGVDVD